MRRVLMVAYYFPPLSTSGAMRPLGFCRHLPECGWAPRVVAADPWLVTPRPSIDAALGRRVPASVHVDRVGHAMPMAALVRWRDAVRRVLPSPSRPQAHAEMRRRADAQAASVVDVALEHLFHVPDAQRFWRRPAINAALGGERPDVVYATGGPWTALLVGRALARRFGVPFVADFRDPWIRNPFRRYLPLVRARHRRLERLVCRAASHIVLNTVELRDQFAADYPEMRQKFVAVSNGFDDSDDRDDGDEGDVARCSRDGAPQPAAPADLWHFGTVYGRRSPEALLQAAANVIDRGHVAPTRIRMHFVGEWELAEEHPATRLARRLEASGIVVREPAVPHRQCLALMRRAPVVIVLQPDSPLQVPAKTFEYIATRRPLVVVGGEGATASLVRRHGLGCCVRNDSDAIDALLVHLANGGAPAAPPADAVRQFTYRTLTARLAAVLDAAANGAAFDAVAF